jgi:hypothetical protein
MNIFSISAIRYLRDLMRGVGISLQMCTTSRSMSILPTAAWNKNFSDEALSRTRQKFKNLSDNIFCIVLLFLTDSCPKGFTLIDFDDIPEANQSHIITIGVPSSFHNFYWDQIYVIDGSLFGENSGYTTTLTSGRYLGWSVGGSIRTRQTFHVKSFIAAAAWVNNLTLTITTSRVGNLVGEKQYTLMMKSASIINLDWNAIDQVKFKTSGGGKQPNFAIENLCIVTPS